MKQGIILKGIGGFYYVKCGEEIYECRARGKFRLDGIKPIPGDIAEVTPPTEVSGGYVEDILPRRNQLVRPAVANLDMLLIVLSAKKPKPDFLLCDKLLIYAKYNNIPCAIVVNKCDSGKPDDIIRQYAGCGAEVITISAQTGQGMDELKELIRGKCVCLAGQSAVGKSSIVNAISPGLMLDTGGLSKKTDRGRHTTRHSELLYIKECDATVIDTPGFSVLECVEIEPEELSQYYSEFRWKDCRFTECLHHKEPDCAVKKQLEEGEIPPERYERYKELLLKLIERKENMYD